MSEVFAKKSLGQNFLSDPNSIRKIIRYIQAESNKNILEIGPGRGALTGHLSEFAHNLVLVEKDKSLYELLQGAQAARQSMALDCHNITLHNADFLDLDLSTIIPQGKTFIAVGNLPYNVASPILIKLFKSSSFFSDFYLMFQKEVAIRLVAKPSTKDYSLLTVWTQVYAQAEILFDLPPTVFRPRPKVTSSFVHFKLRQKPLVDEDHRERFFNFVAHLFQKRRKTILSAMKGREGIDTLKMLLEDKQRAETMSVDELLELFSHL